MNKITAGDTEYRVTGDPSMGTVKYVQEMEIEMMRQYLGDDAILELEQADEENITENVLQSADVDDLKSMMWDRSAQEPLQTICLGVDERLTMDDVEHMSARDFLELKEASEDALGGTATDFIGRLGIGISSRMNEIRDQLEIGENSSENDLPKSVSDLSSAQ